MESNGEVVSDLDIPLEESEEEQARTLRKLSDPNLYTKSSSGKAQDAQILKIKRKRKLSHEPLRRKTSSSEPTTLYKTELCRSFMESGKCKYGTKCQFAHGTEELKDVARHPKYKTEICRTFHTTGYCPYGMRCRFIHISMDEKLLHEPFLLPDTIPGQFDIPKVFLEEEISELLAHVERHGPIFNPLPALENLRIS